MNTRFPAALATAIAGAAVIFPLPADAEIYRWDNNQIIPGTVGIWPAPSVNLASLNLSYAKLASTSLQSANLLSATLSYARLTSADLTSANLASTVMWGATLPSTNLSAAQFVSADIRSTSFASANLTSANFSGAYFSLPDFTGATVAGTDFSGVTGFTESDFKKIKGNAFGGREITGARFVGNNMAGWQFRFVSGSGANFSSTNLAGASFDFGTLTSADFTAANLASAFLGTANFTSAILARANLVSVAGYYANFTSASLVSADLTGGNFNTAHFLGADLTAASIRGGSFVGVTDLTAAQLYSTASYQLRNLSGTAFGNAANWNLSSQNLASATFNASSLASTNFTSANLTSAHLVGADFTGANLTGAVIARADFSYAKNLSPSQLAATADFQAHDLTGLNLFSINLAGCDFSNQNLTSANLSYDTLISANFTGTTLRFTNLRSATFSSAQLYSSASYQNRDLTGIGLRSVIGWDFTSQNLTSANFANGDAMSARFTSANLTSAALNTCSLIYADFTGANIKGANFNGSDFTQAMLYSTASYQQHDLTGVGWNNPVGGWNLAGQNLTRAYFDAAILSDSDFTSANLTSANFNNANLWGSNLLSANLTGADLTRTNLTLADLRGAIGFLPVFSTTLRGTILPDATVTPFTMNNGEGFRIRAGVPVTVNGAITMPAKANLIFSATAILNVSSLTTNALVNLFFDKDAQLRVTATNGLTLNGGVIQFPNAAAPLGFYKIIQYAGSIQGAGITSLTLPATANNIAYAIDTTTNPGFITLHRGYLGDANDDGLVNFSDFVLLSNNFGANNANWSQADFNNDHLTNFSDFVILSNNFGQSISGGAFTATPTELAAMNAFAANANPVPEPATLPLLALASALLVRRRR